MYKAGPKFELVAQNALNDYCLSSSRFLKAGLLRTSKQLWVIGDRKK